MKINKIKLCNISSYAGEREFDFSVSDNKSIILIGGQNGTGKTSLFTALKLALYGHLCFNYQSTNAQYLTKIKDLINHDAFTSNEVKAYVEVEIEIPNERDIVKYNVLREWEFVSQKLTETTTIHRDDVKLKDDELVFFQNYLFTVLPPNLFDFFFFDGEQIADFFATNTYNSYIKNAFLTLCSFDTFELIRKFCENYVVSDKTSTNVDEINAEYETVLEDIHGLEDLVQELQANIEAYQASLEQTYLNKEELEAAFKKSGGLTKEEKEALLKESQENEKIKNVANVYIRSFVENMLPFVIAKNISVDIQEQLEKESEVKDFAALQAKLSSEQVYDVIKATMANHSLGKVDDSFIKELTEAITDTSRPEFDVESFAMLHDLSREQRERVDVVLRYLDKFKKDSILKKIKSKAEATEKTIAINKSLRDAMSEMDAESYSAKFNELTNEEFDLKKKIDETTIQLSEESTRLEELKAKRNNLLEQLKADAKSKNVYALTEKISGIMNSLISDLTFDKFKEIEDAMLKMLKIILRKDNFIDLVELDENFNIYLYKNQTYSIEELENLVANIGYDELAKRIGNTGVSNLMKALNTDSIADVKKYLKKQDGQVGLFADEDIDLFSKVEFNQLSKGEKQIFILSLYYAIILVSGKDIPFVIDTPYARIDTEHREQISKEFFPNISNQVIILSTDEEITQTYYDVIKPHISKEYLLQYDEAESKTNVSNGYFF